MKDIEKKKKSRKKVKSLLNNFCFLKREKNFSESIKENHLSKS